MWRSPPPGSKGKIRRPPSATWRVGSTYLLSRRVSRFQDREGAKACDSFSAKRKRRVNRSYILFLVLVSFVFAMLFAGASGDFVMRSNNPIDACPNTHKPSRSFWSFEKGRSGAFVSSRARSNRTEISFVSPGRSPNAREGIVFLRAARNLGAHLAYLSLCNIGVRTRSAAAF